MLGGVIRVAVGVYTRVYCIQEYKYEFGALIRMV
jgi:hypothetical protein